MDNNMSNILDEVLESLEALSRPSADAQLVVKDSSEVDIPQLIADRICGLLLEDSLTTEQIALLAVLMKAYSYVPFR
jgi:hypothetical protein